MMDGSLSVRLTGDSRPNMDMKLVSGVVGLLEGLTEDLYLIDRVLLYLIHLQLSD